MKDSDPPGKGKRLRKLTGKRNVTGEVKQEDNENAQNDFNEKKSQVTTDKNEKNIPSRGWLGKRNQTPKSAPVQKVEPHNSDENVTPGASSQFEDNEESSMEDIFAGITRREPRHRTNNVKAKQREPSVDSGDERAELMMRYSSVPLNTEQTNTVIDEPQEHAENEHVEMIACPMCNEKFDMKSIEAHASECDGPKEDVQVVDEDETQDFRNDEDGANQNDSDYNPNDEELNTMNPINDDQELLKSNIAPPNKMETCFLCAKQVSSGQEYARHVNLCLESREKEKSPPLTRAQRTRKTWGGASLMSQLHREYDDDNFHNANENQGVAENQSSSYESGSGEESGEEEEGEDEEFDWTQISNSPIKTFKAVSKQAGSFIDYKNQFPHQRALAAGRTIKRKFTKNAPKKRKRKRKASKKKVTAKRAKKS